MNKTNYTFLKTITLGMMLIVGANQLSAQSVNNGIFFQAVARDNFSNPAKERKIYVQSSVIQTSTNGPSLLVEQFQVNTDGNGMFSISIGNGTRVGGTASGLNAIDWSQGPFFLNLKIAITPAAGNVGWDYTKEWVNIGTTSFGAVPYALYSANAGGVNQKLSITDTTKMLAVYAKSQAVQALSTTVETKLSAKDTLTMLAPYAKAAYVLDSAYIKSELKSKVSSADSVVSYVTPTSLKNATIIKLNIADSLNAYVTPTSLSTAINTSVPYSGATGAVNLGAHNLTVNGLSAGMPSSGIQNTMFGYAPFVNGTPGDNNTAIGFATLQSLNGGNDNTAVGTNAIRQGAIGGAATGSRNTALGSAALSNGNVPSDNTAIGYNTLSVVTGGANTAVGSGALLANTTGSNNTAIGYSANVGSGTLSNATAIGNGATVTTSNTIQLGNTSVTDVKTSGTITAGAITYPNAAGTNGQVLTSNGSGTASWQSKSAVSHSKLADATTASVITVGNLKFRFNTSTGSVEVLTLSGYKNMLVFATKKTYTVSISGGGGTSVSYFNIEGFDSGLWKPIINLYNFTAPASYRDLITIDYYQTIEFHMHNQGGDLNPIMPNESYKVFVTKDGYGLILLRVDFTN
jgi:hypothetical protein